MCNCKFMEGFFTGVWGRYITTPTRNNMFDTCSRLLSRFKSHDLLNCFSISYSTTDIKEMRQNMHGFDSYTYYVYKHNIYS